MWSVRGRAICRGRRGVGLGRDPHHAALGGAEALTSACRRRRDEGSLGAQAVRPGDESYRRILPTHTCRHTHERTHMCTHERTHTCTHERAHMHAHMGAQAHTHVHTRAHTHAHTETLTHRHTQISLQVPDFSPHRIATFQVGSHRGLWAVGNQHCPASPPDPHLRGS